jgi:excisionase family DNA binding protein
MTSNTNTEQAQQWPAYLDVPGAANYLSISVRHVYQLIQKRQIPHSKIGGRISFNRQQLDQWHASNARPMQVGR